MVIGRRTMLCVLFAVLLPAQALLALNPGWFSHDELQWGAQADVAGVAQLPWVDWADVAALQWRPLTFNLWLLLAHALFAAPVAWHGLWVLAGSGIATGLAALLLRLGVRTPVAAGAALLFALGPYATYVHGWAATLADLLVVAIALALAHALLGLRARAAAAAATAAAASAGVPAGMLAVLATAGALAAKESALCFAPLLALCWAIAPRERVFAAAAAGATAVTLAYLALRLPVLLQPRAGAYAVDPSLVPRNWAAYHLFVLRPSTFEPASIWRASTASLLGSAAFWLVLWALLARASWRLALAAIAGGALWLAPMLPIAMVASQYGYGFSAWIAGVVALAWAKFGRAARIFVAVFALATLLHGVNVQRQMRAAGERQAVFQPALVAALAAHDGELRLYVEPERAWLYGRLTHEVPAYHGAAIGDRVRWVDSPADADLVIAADGHLEKGDVSRQ